MGSLTGLELIKQTTLTSQQVPGIEVFPPFGFWDYRIGTCYLQGIFTWVLGIKLGLLWFFNFKVET